MKIPYKNIEKKKKKSHSQKMKRSDIKYFLTIYFLTKTTQKCENVADVNIALYFSNFFLYFTFVQSNE